MLIVVRMSVSLGGALASQDPNRRRHAATPGPQRSAVRATSLLLSPSIVELQMQAAQRRTATLKNKREGDG
ncbi:hypothetical protein CMUS01_06541 [Colletotrichum musicola]|uniref:Secreted protein n=1 Tax=Colletotrichum musicola TaxID=2175873 RepID=A0A8H6NH80_9PEZI|nr:hypothetical protein CMUS01_06541 [Colletotrichum musicola]